MEQKEQTWFSKHADTLIILGSVCGSMIWMNSQFNSVNCRFYEIEKDIAIIKTCLVMKEIYPKELAKGGE